MAVTSEQVRAALDPEEPDYEAAAELGPDALPHLQRFVEGPDPNLASKAAYLAGRIGDPQAAPILEQAATSDDPAIRAAAAGGVRHLPDEQADAVLQTLLDDDEPGVRKTALKAVPETRARTSRRRSRCCASTSPSQRSAKSRPRCLSARREEAERRPPESGDP